MYIPKHFEETNQNEIFNFIEENSFGQLISTVNGRLFSTHIPFLLSSDRQSMLCHIAKQNPQHLELESQQALITLSAEHDYISPTWYERPAPPTWNYRAVHIYGRCSVIQDPDELASIVEMQTAKYEATMPNPWQPNYPNTMLGGIVGIKLSIDQIQCKYKLSQNRPKQDRETVIAELKEKGSNKMATVMENYENSRD